MESMPMPPAALNSAPPPARRFHGRARSEPDWSSRLNYRFRKTGSTSKPVFLQYQSAYQSASETYYAQIDAFLQCVTLLKQLRSNMLDLRRFFTACVFLAPFLLVFRGVVFLHISEQQVWSPFPAKPPMPWLYLAANSRPAQKTKLLQHC